MTIELATSPAAELLALCDGTTGEEMHVFVPVHALRKALAPQPFSRRDFGSYTDNQLKYIKLGWNAAMQAKAAE